MTRIRPQSLSGLLSAALLLIVLPLTAALVYGGVQLRELSRTSDVLVRDSIALTQQTQMLFQHITLMERAASVYGVLNDPRVARGFETASRRSTTPPAASRRAPASGSTGASPRSRPRPARRSRACCGPS
jgi:hypothetical protein